MRDFGVQEMEHLESAVSDEMLGSLKLAFGRLNNSRVALISFLFQLNLCFFNFLLF